MVLLGARRQDKRDLKYISNQVQLVISLDIINNIPLTCSIVPSSATSFLFFNRPLQPSKLSIFESPTSPPSGLIPMPALRVVICGVDKPYEGIWGCNSGAIDADDWDVALRFLEEPLGGLVENVEVPGIGSL